MFLRTSSSSFGVNSAKSQTFKGKMQNSMQFGGHRSSIANGNFSYYMNFSTSDVFNQQTTPEQFTRQWRGFGYSPTSFVAYALKQYGIKEVFYKFDGCGDSGDFDYENTIHKYDNITVDALHGKGMIDAVNAYQDHFCRALNWQGVSSGVKEFSIFMEDAADSKLNSEYGGWEINSGSYGEVTLSCKGIQVDYNQKTEYCDVCDEEYYDDGEGCSCLLCHDCYEKSPQGSTECDHCHASFVKSEESA